MTDTYGRARRRDLRRARTGITVITVTTLLVVLVVGAVLVVGYFRRELIQQEDDRLRSSARSVAVFRGSDVGREQAESLDIPVQVVDGDGTVLFATAPIARDPALWRPGQPMAPHAARSPSLGDVRVVVVRNDFGWVVLVAPMAPIDEDVDALRAVLFVALPIATLVIGVLIWLAVGRALRPVAEARAREERLLSDVGHELQSPIAGMRALMETEPSSPVGMRANRAVVLDELSRLEAVTEQLLELGHRRHASAAADTPVDLDEVVHREVARLAPQSGCHVDASAVRPGQVVGDEEALASMVDNLLRNAIRHASTSVVTSLAEHGDTVLLTIEDDGPGIGRADRSRVFDRFVRLDESRTRSDGGAGLGLAIVEEIVHAHRGSIDVEDGSLGGARFVVRLPASATLG